MLTKKQLRGRAEAQARWRERNPNYLDTWRKENSERVKVYKRKWYKNNKHLDKGYRLKSKYDLHLNNSRL